MDQLCKGILYLSKLLSSECTLKEEIIQMKLNSNSDYTLKTPTALRPFQQHKFYQVGLNQESSILSLTVAKDRQVK